MTSWQTFEIESTNYLNSRFGKYAHFNCLGGSDSTVSDIKVVSNNGKTFYIEAKQCPAQCGQFVLLPNIRTKTFDYSQLNSTILNKYSLAIMEHMNRYFDEYKEAGTAGKDIEMQNGPTIFASWIIQSYKDKGARFIITNNNVILPIDDFSKYFYISAKYRVKRSGSSSVGKSQISVVSNFLRNNFPITSIQIAGDKLFVLSNEYLHNKRFVIAGVEYMISQRDNRYEIRKLSNTFNANVIFSINLKYGVRGLSDEEFISFLR